MRRKGILIIGVVMALATAGIVYAHWQSTLVAEGNVQTGALGVGWSGAFTNDDADDEGGEVWDMWPGSSGRDPANPDGSERYDKDVAGCWAEDGGDYFHFWVQNAYPSYHCMVGAMLGNYASIPVKATAMRITVGYERCDYYYDDGLTMPVPFSGNESGEWEENGTSPESFDPPTDVRISHDESGPFLDYGNDGSFDSGDVRLYADCYPEDDGFAFVPGGYEGNFAIGQGDPFEAHITGDIGMGVRCGTQIDPGEAFETAGWIHVEQPAWQNYGYNFRLEQDFVNWNEFSYCMCTDDVPAANADGEIIGTVDHSIEGCLDVPPEEIVSAPMGYNSAYGWAGWSCPAGTTVVDAWVEPEDWPTTQEVLWVPGACETGGTCWPNTPFGYTYGPDETGFIVQGATVAGPPAYLHLLCQPNP